jgi:hypothetical protein
MGWVPVSRSRKFVLGLAVVLGVAACVLISAGVWVAGLVGLATVVTTVGALWPVITSRPKALPPPELQVPDWVIGRPAELAQVVAALTSDQVGTVGITTALQGADGFGKTTLAQMVRADRRVTEAFRRAGVPGHSRPGCAWRGRGRGEDQ